MRNWTLPQLRPAANDSAGRDPATQGRRQRTETLSEKQARPSEGSPSHAGMAAQAGATLVLTGWFPRTRGDGRRRDGRLASRTLVPTHTRGWISATWQKIVISIPLLFPKENRYGDAPESGGPLLD